VKAFFVEAQYLFSWWRTELNAVGGMVSHENNTEGGGCRVHR
jgi:hypothetical protein